MLGHFPLGGAPLGGDEGPSGVTGSGALVSQSASIDGAGGVSVHGTGALVAGSAAIDGAGFVDVGGSGALLSGSAVADGSGFVGVGGSGDLQAQSAAIDGTGNVSIGGTGDLAAGAASIDGSGSVTITIHVSSALEIVFGSRINAALEVVNAYLARVAAPLEIVSPIRSRVTAALDIEHPIRSFERVQKAITLVHSMSQAATVLVTDAPTLTIHGEVIPLESATVEMDEGDLWRCRVGLADPLHFGLFNADDPFTVDLGGEEFAFIVDSVSFERAGQVSMAATVAGIGPGAVYASPRAAKLSRTWDAAVLATAVVEELFGVGVVDWRILNWSIPANKLAVENQAPMDVLKRVAESPGAVTEAEPGGELYVRYLFPVSVQVYPSATPDQEYNDTQHNFTTSEQTVRPVLVNKLRILDAEQSSNQDAIEFEQDAEDPTRGEIKVFPSPWRDSVTLEHTGDATRVSASVRGIETEELTETVEVIGGKGSVSKPINSVVSLEWKTVNLTGVTFEADSNEFTTTHATLKESLLEITYLTRFIAYDAAAYVDAEVQFLVREDEAA